MRKESTRANHSSWRWIAVNNILFLVGISLLFVSCSKRTPKYVIGVSQCSEDIWRDKLNNELKIGTYFHDGVELRFASADDSDEKQIEQINQFVKDGIDLLIVAPNQVATVSPAIDAVFDKGIPVIVFDRKTYSEKYTAYIGADNYEMGRMMGEYIATRLNGKGRVLEILGLKGSSPAIERHNGFESALKGFPGITLVASLQGDWTEQSAADAIKDYQGDLSYLDFVFGQNDRMAVGARRALSDSSLPLFCGIDGLPGDGNGIACVRDSLLEASYIYPTHGDEVLQLAMNILEGKPYQKDNPLKAALVTKDNANVLLMQNEEMVRHGNYLDKLHEQSDAYLKQLGYHRIVIVLASLFILLLLVLMVIIYRYYLQKARIQEERTQMEREQLDFYTQVSHELRTPLTLIEGPLAQLAETKDMQEAGADTSGLFSIIQRNTHQLTQLINKMLNVQAFGRIENEKIELIGDSIQAIPETSTENNEHSLIGTTILIVDDNADIRAYLRTILQDKYQVNEAADGQQGLALANEIVPDLIVSDVMMPVMNGLEFCQRVKRGMATSHIPVILLTARALNQHHIEGYESGADAYITKPFSADLLLARINNLLKNRHLLRGLFGSTKIEKKTVEESVQEAPVLQREDAFLLKFHDYIKVNLSDSDLSVETIGAELGLSRVQLYRKVKALTGQSPVELLRTARLNKGRELLQTTDKNISEVAYEVGFTAPSYFTKCFKDEFGISPSDL